jgi:hypothetical protein
MVALYSCRPTIAWRWLISVQGWGRSTVRGFVPQPRPTGHQGDEGSDVPRVRCMPVRKVIKGDSRALEALSRRSASPQLSDQMR